MADSVSAALQDCQNKVDSGMKSLLNDLDNTVLRKLQKEMYLCSARCCDQLSGDRQGCIQRCQQPAQQTEEYVQKELTDFLDRLQRCTLQCQDEAKDKIRDNMSSSDEAKVRKNLEGCLIKCGDKHVAMFPALKTRLSDHVSKFL
ncbi:protein FAM136A-like [Lytechinus variegatus]|uniref:protein FAM136A-like n=1 Tax=Lytechinus variegatus TaxID=7654 RepID=UPI001BB0EAFB|nr:protein FAM136A-like [Lytechinus variegatus]